MNWDDCVLWLEKAMQGRKWIDQSKYNNNGAMIGARFKESSIDFDGVDDYVNCGKHASLNISGAVTTEVLLKFTTTEDYKFVVGKKEFADPWDGFNLFVADNNSFVFRVYGNTANATLTTGIYAADTWHHVVGTHNGGAVQKLYVNGKLADSDTINTGDISTTQDLLVGMLANDTYHYKGRIALVRVYRAALTAQQIQEVYEQCYRLL